ncbi:unnamed protein product [Rotaria magnacalcarata]
MKKKKPAQSSLLYGEPQTMSNKIGRPHDSDSRYSVRFIIITGIIGFICLVAAISLIIIGTIGLRDYGFANGPLIAGIVLFGVGGALIIVACLAAETCHRLLSSKSIESQFHSVANFFQIPCDYASGKRWYDRYNGILSSLQHHHRSGRPSI